MKSFNLAEQLDMLELPAQLVRVQQGLEAAVATDNATISKPVSRLINAPSKRIRSALVIAAAGKQANKKIISACVAIELIHLASLVHDDIMDQADSRRGVATVHTKEGLNTAILVGDYLFAKAHKVAASVSLQAAELVAATIISLCDGQARELADLGNIDRTIESYLQAVHGKTASLISAACQIGSLCGEPDPKQITKLARFGESFGMAFQLLDDVLDFLSNEQQMGKAVGKDIAEGVYTMPVILALQGPGRKQILKGIKNKINTAKVTGLLIEIGAIQSTVDEVEKYNQIAKESIKDLASNNLQDLPIAYTEWVLLNIDKHGIM